MQNFHVRRISLKELTLPMQWARAEGWQPGIDDARHFYTADPNGFFMGFLNDEPISSISAVAYNDYYGFIGLYIVRPEFRYQGYGLATWNKAMDYLQNRNIGLDGVIAQQSNYQKFGFKIAYRNLRFQTVATGQTVSHSDNIVALSNVPFEKLLGYDVFPTARPLFLKSWIQQQYGNALGIVKNGELVGYGVIRACHESFRIGALFADSAELAEQLLKALLSYAPVDSPVFIDVPEINESAMALVKRYAMSLVFETARMYTQSAPLVDVNKIYGVNTLELG